MKHLCLALAIFLTAISCGREGRVIPAHKFAKIYAQMLVADQRAKNDNRLSKLADTTMFYEPILNDFGYTSKDYVRSVGHYMEDPESFEKIFKETKKILKDRIAELTAEERARERADSIRKAIEQMDFRRASVYFGTEPDSARRDTVFIMPDSSGILTWKRIMPDTIYHGPAFRIVEAHDSIVCKTDSISATDSTYAISKPLAPILDKKFHIDTAETARPLLPLKQKEAHRLRPDSTSAPVSLKKIMK